VVVPEVIIQFVLTRSICLVDDLSSRLGEKSVALKALYVRCKVSLGNFETEFYVSLDNSSAFVSRDSVKVDRAPESGREVDGQVLAYLISEERDKALVQLPGEPAVGGLRAWVPRSALAAG